MKDFWASHEWEPGESRLHWHVLFDDQPEVRNYVEAHKPIIDRHAELHPVPAQWLHMTIQSIPRSVAPSQVTDMLQGARAAVADLEPFEVEVGPVMPAFYAVVPAIYPEQGIVELYKRLRDVTEGVLGDGALPKAHEEFWPHFSLAYSGANWDQDALTLELAEFRPPRVRARITTAVLVNQRQVFRDTYTWDVIDVISLGREGKD